MPRLITILRRTNNLVAILSDLTNPLGLSLDTIQSWPRTSLENCYKYREAPVISIDKQIYQQKDRLLAAWQHLQAVDQFDSTTLTELLIVLIETQLDTNWLNPVLPALKLDFKDITPAATAAHPRAYQGTKYQPPKSKTCPAIDLQPYLSDPKSTTLLLAKLWPYWSESLTQLAQHGYSISSLAKVTDTTKLDSYLAYHYGITNKDFISRWPKTFVHYILPLLNLLPWPVVLQTLQLYQQLGLDNRRYLLPSVMRLLVIGKDRLNNLEWLRLVSLQPRKHQTIWLNLLLLTGAYRIKFSPALADICRQFPSLVRQAYYIPRLYWLLLSIYRQHDLDYLLAGLRLAQSYQLDYQFDRLNSCAAFPYDQVVALIEYLSTSKKFSTYLAMRIWQACGELPGFTQIITQVPWPTLTPDIAYGFLEIYLSFCWLIDDAKEQQRYWPMTQAESQNIVKLVHTIDTAYQSKCLEIVDTLLWKLPSQNFVETAQKTYVVAQKLSQKPFQQNVLWFSTSYILRHFIHYSGKAWAKFLQAPNSSFLSVEKHCRSENSSRLIEDGIETLLQLFADLIVDSFISIPNKLLQTAKLAGSLKPEMRLLTLAPVKQLPIMQLQVREDNLFSVCETLAQTLPTTLPSPIPKQLSAYLAGTKIANKPRLEHYLTQFQQNLLATKLALIEHYLTERLLENAPIKAFDSKVLTAFKFAYLIDANQRAFKRFLKAYLRNDSHYLQQHPAAQTWLKEHKNLNLALWLRGIDYIYESQSLGTVRIVVEQDPLKAVEMGTYVNSCLGLGGNFMYSAVAVVLDINKQVLYAYDKQQKVIGRQLLAISSQNRLVCFEVYPTNVTSEIQAMFREYDRLFAQALGLEINQDIDYEITNVLSQEWWDDRAWDLKLSN